jgi:pantothenate kinase
MDAKLGALLRSLTARPQRRLFLAIAGAPASGKSTLARDARDFVTDTLGVTAAVLEMDGFHLDNAELRIFGKLDRKGSPETFDVFGLRNTIDRLKQASPEGVLVPIFDRELDLARAGARLIAADTRLIIVEGNYLSADVRPWDILMDAFDATVFLDVPRDVLKSRLQARWEALGFSPQDIARKVEGNDLPNADFVLSHSRRPDLTLGKNG